MNYYYCHKCGKQVEREYDWPYLYSYCSASGMNVVMARKDLA